MKESIRLTSSTMSLRKAGSDTEVKTSTGKCFLIRKGDYTMFYSPVLHMDSEIFENADVSAC